MGVCKTGQTSQSTHQPRSTVNTSTHHVQNLKVPVHGYLLHHAYCASTAGSIVAPPDQHSTSYWETFAVVTKVFRHRSNVNAPQHSFSTPASCMAVRGTSCCSVPFCAVYELDFQGLVSDINKTCCGYDQRGRVFKLVRICWLRSKVLWMRTDQAITGLC